MSINIMNPKSFLFSNEITEIKSRLEHTFKSIIIPLWEQLYNKENTWQQNVLGFIEYHDNMYDDKIPNNDSLIYNSIVKNEHYVDLIMYYGIILFINEECIDITTEQFENDKILCELTHWEFIDNIILFHYMTNTIYKK
jgi:hypothetical protein